MTVSVLAFVFEIASYIKLDFTIVYAALDSSFLDSNLRASHSRGRAKQAGHKKEKALEKLLLRCTQDWSATNPPFFAEANLAYI